MIDFFVAFTAALMIFPSAFAFGINPGQGPGLVFVTLPGIFNQMAFGQLVSIVFFVLLAIAALTSTMSLLEVIVSFMSSEFGIKRKMATFIVSALTICSGIICAISSTIFNFFDNFSANVMLPLGAFFIILFVPLVLGKQKIKAELEAHGQEFSLFNIFYFLVRFIVPIAIGALFIYCIAGWLF
jgi:NSS family neurotransmitter:Na+ symporter